MAEENGTVTLSRKRFYKSGGASYTLPGVGGYIYLDPRILSSQPPESISVNIAGLKEANAAVAERQSERDAARAKKLADREAKLAERADKLVAKAKRAQEIADRAKAAAEKLKAAQGAAPAVVESADQPFEATT